MKTMDFRSHLGLRDSRNLLRRYRRGRSLLRRMEPHTMARSGKDGQETSGYRSPWRVLVRFFEKSRDLWKAKCQALEERIKEFRTEVRDLRRSRD